MTKLYKKKYCSIKNILLMFLFITFFSINLQSKEIPPVDLYINVAVSIVENPMSHKILEYFGKLKRTQYLNIINNKNKDGFFKLYQVGWINKQSQYIQYYKMPYVPGSNLKPYSSTMFFRIKDITRLAIIKKTFVETIMDKN